MDFDGDGFCDYNDFLAVILARILTIKLKQSQARKFLEWRGRGR